MGGINLQNRLICITGPTASGKTVLSIVLARQKQTEIISADSMQIYRYMDIGTAKPTITERAGITHYMLDICQPNESFSVARYVELADQYAQRILAQGKVPIVVGGTGLYLDALIECSKYSGYEVDLSFRQSMQDLANKSGNEAVHALLCQVDPVSADKLHPNNLKRVIRALEVYHQTGMTLNELNLRNKRITPKYQAVKIGLCPSNREILYNRINLRVDRMMENGLLNEVRQLYNSGLLVGTAAQAIGYKEFLPYFQGQRSLEQCVLFLKQQSRNYAKRQLTWLKRDSSIHWINYDKESDFNQVICCSTKYLQSCGV